MAVKATLLFLRQRYVCIQVNTMPDFLVFTTLIPRLFGSKILLDMHEPIPELWITKFGKSRFSLIIGLQMSIEQLAIKYADMVITVNDTIRKRFIDRGADPRKIGVIRNVPDERISINSPKQESKDEFTMIIHGSIEKYYGHKTIINALNLLHKKIKYLKLLVVGDGGYSQQLQRLIEKRGLSNYVHFTGYVSHNRINEYISHSDMGLVSFLPSPFSELCQPNKLFEYIALNKPVVCSRLKAIEEIFDDSSVMFFEPGNAKDLARCILKLYRNPDKAKQLVENASVIYEKMKWDKTKNVYLGIVDDLTGNFRETSRRSRYRWNEW